MTFRSRSLQALSFLGVFLALTFLCSVSSFAQIPDIEVHVSDTTSYANVQNTVISIYLSNREDTISGFNLWLQLDRPDIMIFQTDSQTVYDTTFYRCDQYSGPDCIDSTIVPGDSAWNFFYVDTSIASVGNFDTVGTLTQGWELVDARSLSGVGTDLNIVGISDFSGGLTGIPAGQQGGLLIKVLADVLDVPDTLVDRTVNILVQTDFKDHYGFVRPDGSLINWLPQEIEDTACFVCNNWVGETCFNYEQVPLGFYECDSIYVNTDTILVLDTANVKAFDGSLTVEILSECGNFDGDPSGVVDISDLLAMVDYMFLVPPGPGPDPACIGNVDCTGGVDVSDLLYLVDYMFVVPPGPAPCTACCQ